MGRFLIYFSYFGTQYSKSVDLRWKLQGGADLSIEGNPHGGVQSQAGVLVKGKPLRTVADTLEKALKCLLPSNGIKITLSSRTDKGVHALKNACHVDLEFRSAEKEYSPVIVTNIMNNYLRTQGEDVRVLQTIKVPDTFNARHRARRRKYVYRLGHILDPGAMFGRHDKSYCSELFYQEMKKFASNKTRNPTLPLGEPLSILDTCKAVIYREKLDISKLIAAAELVSGIHNFTSFSSKSQVDPIYLPHPVKLLTIGLKRGQPFGHHLVKHGLDVTDNIEFWDINVQSQSFLYKQVRRLVGGMVLVARNIISLDNLQQLILNPQTNFPFAGNIVANESGLFMLDVEYDPNELEYVETAQTSIIPEQEEAVTQSPHDADVTSSCVGSNQNDTDSESSFNDQVDEQDDKENDQFSEDDDVTSTVSPEKAYSTDLKLANCQKGIPEHS